MSRSGADDAAFAIHATAALDGPTKRKSLLRRGWDGYENGLSRFVGFTARKYGDLGAFTARRPVLVVVATLVLSAAICLGWMRYREETSDVLWVPQRGKSVDDRDYVEANYPKSKAGASFYAQLAPTQYATYGGDNAVQLSVTWEMFELHNKVLALTVDNDAGQPVTFWDLCYRTLNGSCDIGDGYLWHWYKSFDLFKTENSATSPVNGNETAFRQRVSQTVYPDGGPVNLLSVFGLTTIGFNPFRLEAAQVIACDYSLDESVSDETVTRWNDAFTDLMKAELPKQQYMTFTWITGDSVGEELGSAIDNDMLLIFASIIVFIIIAIIFLSKPSMVATRTMLAVLGVFVTALGIVSGWGWGMIFGMPFTPLQKLSPFILLGMGVDVVFILVKSYEIIIQRQPWLPLDQAFRKLMSTAGLSVQVTLLASSVAFALGSVDELASVRWFSAFATLNTLMIMVLMMTLFVGLMVLTERRIRARRWDCCCCVVSKDAAAAGIPQQQPPAPWLNSACSTPSGQQAMERPGQVAGMVSDDDVKDENLIKKFFRKFYAPALTRWWVKVPIILIFLAWAIASWYGIYQMEYGQPLSDLAPDGSYLQDYDKVQRATYQQQVGESAALYFRDIDASNPVQQYKMLKAWDLALQDDFVNATTSAFQSNWLVNFISWVNATDSSAIMVLQENNCYNPIIPKLSGNLATVNTPTKSTIPGCVRQDRFYELFNRWSMETGTTSDVICTGKQLCSVAGATILTSRLNFMLIPPANDDLYTTHLIHSMRDLEDEISSSVFAAQDDAAGTYVSFTYNSNFMYYTGDAILPHQALIYFMLALVGVGVVCTFMLVNPIASLLMMVSVGLVVLYLFGELWVLGIKFNQVSIINMIMATGLSVDYSVYFAQKFMTVTADGTGNGRMHAALTDTGSAVFIGGFTALCGTVPMAFAKSVIIRTFFKLIFGTILFALLTGLVLMPVVFSWIPLPPVKSVLVEEQTPPAAAQAVQQKKALQAEMAVQHDMSLQPEINVSCSTTTFSSEERSTV